MFSDPQFWVAIAFILFVAIIFNPVRKILKNSLDLQIKQITASITEAENLKNEAQITFNEIKKRHIEIEKEIQIMHEEAQNKIKLIEKISSEKLETQIKKRQLQADEKITQLVRDANNEIQQFITTTAIEAARNLLQKKLDKDEKQNLINASVEEFNIALKN